MARETMSKFFKAAAVAAVMLTTAPNAALSQDISANDVARFLSGMEIAADSPAAKFTKDAGWQAHSKVFDKEWANLDKRQIARVREWSAGHIKAPKDTLFYFFSGPDFLYADAFYPKAKTYVLAGLEPVGPIPHLDDRTRHTLPAIRSSLDNMLKLSFFVTQDMNNKLRGNAVKGALPLIYVFLTRSGKTIRDVKLITLDNNGVEQPMENAKGRQTAAGAKISFTSGDGAPQTLYYFSTDLSDAGVKSSGFLKFSEKLAPGDGLVKSASYLLHGGNFSIVRNFLLKYVSTMVQDDTGIPAALLKNEEWELSPFGTYIGPIAVFSNGPQPKMRELFAKKNNPPKLDFGIGYRYRGHDSNLLLAIKKPQKAEAR